MRAPEAGSITFEAMEDLMAKPSGQVLLYKGAQRSLQLTRNRALESYINEFCGMLGISRKLLTFTRPAEVEASAAAAASANLPDLVPITEHCHVQVFHCGEFHNAPKPLLKPALKQLFLSGLHSDIQLLVQNGNGEGETAVFSCHKSVLMTRCPYFRRNLTESTASFPLEGAPAPLFRLLLQWIYSAETEIPDDFKQTLQLHSLASRFEMQCLKQRCEEELIVTVTPQKVLQRLRTLYSTPDAPECVLDHCKSTFLRNFPEVLESSPDLEAQLAELPGLTVALFQHVADLQRKKNKRKVHFAPALRFN